MNDSNLIVQIRELTARIDRDYDKGIVNDSRSAGILSGKLNNLKMEIEWADDLNYNLNGRDINHILNLTQFISENDMLSHTMCMHETTEYYYDLEKINILVLERIITISQEIKKVIEDI